MRAIVINGKSFPSVAAAARYFAPQEHITTDCWRMRYYLGCDLRGASRYPRRCQKNSRPVKYNGAVYPSVSSLACELGLSWANALVLASE